MSHNNNALTLGSPEFSDPALAALVRTGNPLAAWTAAVAKGPADAARAISGDFAVGLRDESGSVFLAVDRFAIRSMCYRVVDGGLQFAARADALADAQPTLEPQALFDYLYFHAIPSPRTIFKRVYRVPPGHYVWYHNGQLTVAPYWVPAFNPPSGSVSFAALKAEFRDLLREAVKRQLAGGKTGCFLSGGTDSS